MGVQADYRAAAVALMVACAADADVPLQVYPGRPRSVAPPTGFVDSMGDEYEGTPGASMLFRHTPIVELVFVWGTFDSKEAVNQRDAWVDAFHDWVRQRPHEVSGASLISPRSLDDIPVFVPDWLPESEQRTFFATRLVLEGLITD